MSISPYHFSVHGLTANLMTLGNRRMSRDVQKIYEQWRHRRRQKAGWLIFYCFFTVIPVRHFFQQIFLTKVSLIKTMALSVCPSPVRRIAKCPIDNEGICVPVLPVAGEIFPFYQSQPIIIKQAVSSKIVQQAYYSSC